MDLNTEKVRELLDKRDAIDQELRDIFGAKEKRSLKCSICSSDEHTARTCPQKPEK